jgi:hypothetical protein
LFPLFYTRWGYPERAEAIIVGSFRRYPPRSTHNHGTTGRASGRPARAYAAKGGASGPHTPPCRPGLGPRDEGKQAPGTTPVTPPETAKHQATETAIKSRAVRKVSLNNPHSSGQYRMPAAQPRPRIGNTRQPLAQAALRGIIGGGSPNRSPNGRQSGKIAARARLSEGRLGCTFDLGKPCPLVKRALSSRRDALARASRHRIT